MLTFSPSPALQSLPYKPVSQKSPYFGQTLVESHAHIHNDASNFGGMKLLTDTILKITEALKLRADGAEPKESHDTRAVLVSPIDGLQTEGHVPGRRPLKTAQAANQELLALCQADPLLKPLAAAQPGRGTSEQLRAQILQARDAGTPFYGIKFHPFYSDVSPAEPSYDPYMEIAREFHLPVVIHAAPGKSDPKNIVALAKRFPDVPVVLYHINLTHWDEQQLKQAANPSEKMDDVFLRLMQDNFLKAARLVKADIAEKKAQGKRSNLYLETSHAKLPPLHAVLDLLGADAPEHMIFGSDMPIDPMGNAENYADKVDRLKKMLSEKGWSKSNIDRFFYGNATKLFHLPSQKS